MQFSFIVVHGPSGKFGPWTLCSLWDGAHGARSRLWVVQYISSLSERNQIPSPVTSSFVCARRASANTQALIPAAGCGLALCRFEPGLLHRPEGWRDPTSHLQIPLADPTCRSHLQIPLADPTVRLLVRRPGSNFARQLAVLRRLTAAAPNPVQRHVETRRAPSHLVCRSLAP